MAGIAATLNGSGRAPGDFAFDGGFAKDAAKLERFKLSEIKHCRECLPPALHTGRHDSKVYLRSGRCTLCPGTLLRCCTATSPHSDIVLFS